MFSGVPNLIHAFASLGTQPKAARWNSQVGSAAEKDVKFWGCPKVGYLSGVLRIMIVVFGDSHGNA